MKNVVFDTGFVFGKTISREWTLDKVTGDDDVDGDDDEEWSVVNSCRFLTQGRPVVSPRRGGTHAVLA